MTNVGILATRCARGLQIRWPSKKRRGRTRPSREGAVRSQEGRRDDRVRAAPAVSCARVDRKTHMSIQVQRKQSGLPCAMVLQLIPCSPRRDQSLFVTVAARTPPRNLTPAIGASGPHDFAVRFTRRSSKAHPRPSLPVPTSVTMANVPSSRDGMASNKQLIWVRSQG